MVAAWLSVVLGAIATGVELAASDPGLLVALPAMAGIHGIIGIGEALITGAAVVLIARTRPVLLESSAKSTDYRSAYVIAAGLVVALIVATLSVISSPSPDGLERVAIDFGFADRAIEPIFELLPGYSSSYLGGEIGQVVVIIGGAILSCLLAVAIGKLIFRLLSRAKASGNTEEISSAGD
jgi:cobalt/nickel transport system permease protein